MNMTNLPTLPGTAPKEPLETETVEANKNQTLPKSEKKADTFSISDIDAITDGDATQENNDDVAGEVLPERISQEAFFSTFKFWFAVPNMIPAKPFPLSTLPIQSEEMEAAREASDALYEIACETKYLSWLVEVESEWMQRLSAIALFSFGKMMAIKMELDARIVKPASKGATGADTIAPGGKNEPAPEGDASTVVNIK